MCNAYEEIAYVPIHVLLDRIELGKKRANARAKPATLLTHITYCANSGKDTPRRNPEDFLPYPVEKVNPLLADFTPEEMGEIDYLIDMRVVTGTTRIEWMQLIGRI